MMKCLTRGLSLKSWISDALQDHRGILRVVDANLLSTEDKFYDEKINCLSSILELALILLCI